MRKRFTGFLALLLIALLLTGCGKASPPAYAPTAAPADEPAAPTPSPSPAALIKDMVIYYGQFGEEAEGHVAALLGQLREVDPDAADRWERIFSLWRSVNGDLEIHEDVLPDGLPDTDELCLVVLGFQLEPDGSMRPELIERLKVALASAEKYPYALIVCTGGGTASNNPSATEAGKMAEYLVANGVAPERVIVEDRSQTTAQNAAFSCAILEAQYPQVRQLAILSSDYHIATGVLLFGAQSILTAAEPGQERFEVVSNAAYPAPTGTLSTMFQAGALIELSGDIETAFEIYYDTYEIHELPPLKTDG